MRSAPFIVTIDGPAASGKSTVSRLLAEKYGWSWVSTGAFYRGLAYVAMRLKISHSDEAALTKLCVDPVWRVVMSPERTQVFLRDEDVTAGIYAEEVGGLASKVSSFPKVREALLEPQRACGKGLPGLVAEGRDCGTVIFPRAQIKVYLTAESHNRAERRAKEQGRDVEEMRRAQIQRDLQDSSRQTAPMQIPKDAIVLDTSDMDVDEVVGHLDEIIVKELALQESTI